MKITHIEAENGDRRGTYIHLNGNEVALAISAYLVAKGVNIRGPRTIVVNEELCEEAKCRVYVDPMGAVNVTEV